MGLKNHGPKISDFLSFLNAVVVVVAGDVGGNMGLFLGCSLLTLFEFIELLWNFLRSRNSKDDDSVEDRENPEQNEARLS